MRLEFILIWICGIKKRGKKRKRKEKKKGSLFTQDEKEKNNKEEEETTSRSAEQCGNFSANSLAIDLVCRSDKDKSVCSGK